MAANENRPLHPYHGGFQTDGSFADDGVFIPDSVPIFFTGRDGSGNATYDEKVVNGKVYRKTITRDGSNLFQSETNASGIGWIYNRVI